MAKRSARSARDTPKRFRLGGGQAEADPLLRDSFFETADYNTISSWDDASCFIVGRTGVGKSAMLTRIAEQNPHHVIRISPEDLSLPYICDSAIIRNLKDGEVDLNQFFIALWKHVFLVEVIRHRYKIKDAGTKARVIETLRQKISQDSTKSKALEYLNEFEDKFWCESDERVREITDSFENQFGARFGVSHPIGVSVSGAGESSVSHEERVELKERYQKIVNQTQLPRLNKMMSVLDEDILDSQQNATWIVIDDLDRDWVGEDLLHDLIVCLLQAVHDLKRVRHLKVLVALRTNLFKELVFTGRRSGQLEKYRDLTINLGWTAHDLEGMLDNRVKIEAAKTENEGISKVKDILPSRNSSRGDPLKHVLRHTLMRPRDAISYLNGCLALGDGSPKITWDMIQDAKAPYSLDRLQALGDEWHTTYPDISIVFGCFTGGPARISPDELSVTMEKILSLPSADLNGWLSEIMTSALERMDAGQSGVDLYQDLVSILYEIGFLGVSTQSSSATFSYDQPNRFWQTYNLGAIHRYVVHPTFWLALGLQHKDGRGELF